MDTRKTSDETVKFMREDLKRLKYLGCNLYGIAEMNRYLKEYLCASTEEEKNKARTKYFLTRNELLSEKGLFSQ